MVNLVRGFPSHCGKPIGFSIVAALSMPRSEGEKGSQIIMQMSIADIRVLFVTIIMKIIFKRFAAEHHTKIMSGRKRYWQPVSVELPKNSMDLWMDFLSTIMYIQKGLKSKEAQRSLMKMSGIRH